MYQPQIEDRIIFNLTLPVTGVCDIRTLVVAVILQDIGHLRFHFPLAIFHWPSSVCKKDPEIEDR